MTQDTKILKEYIKNVLNEDYGDSGGDYGYGGGGGYGGYGGYAPQRGQIAKIFLQPFTDVLKTGAYGISRMSNQLQSAAKTVISSVLATIVPMVKVDFAKIKQEEQERASVIKAKYKDVLDRTNRELRSDDAALAAFLWSPASFITLSAAMAAPAIAANLIDVAAGENEKIKALTSLMRSDAIKIVKDRTNSTYNKSKKYLDNVDSYEDLEQKIKKKIEKGDVEKSIKKSMGRVGRNYQTEKEVVNAYKKGVKNLYIQHLRNEMRRTKGTPELEQIVEQGINKIMAL